MIVRILHFCVIASLVAAAAYVYDIKFQAAMQAEQLAKLRSEIRRERDLIAALRAEWAKLDSPERIQALAQRHLPLKQIDARQIDSLKNLPERPRPPLFANEPDPIAALINLPEESEKTGSLGQGGSR
jgi:hypothetical protein